jgi:hypothetical protein
LFRIIHTLS